MNRITKISQTVKNWLNPKNLDLQKAIQQTVEKGLFSRQDVEFQLNVLRKNVENGEIEEWATRTGLSDQQNARGKKVLCLHAGNLPLVGFQTTLGVILSGADYFGKLSRKDPFLPGSFLKEMRSLGLDQQIKFSTDLHDFQKLNADTVVFAGSETSVPQVKQEINKLKAAQQNAEYIIRTAKFSMVYLDEWNEQVKRDLTEAMLRYGGKGCRSVALVVADVQLPEIKDELEEAIHSFWEENPQHQKPAPYLNYQHAYNQSVERDELWMKNFLIQETEELPETDFTVNWVQGDEEKVRSLKMNFGEVVQSVYTSNSDIDGLEIEPLSQAQKPPLWWKPDGVDVVGRLI